MGKKVRVESKFSNNALPEESVFVIEDYLKIASVKEARILTDKIYSENRPFLQKFKHLNYEVSWAWYSDIHQFCISFLEIKGLLEKIELLNPDEIKISKTVSPIYKEVIQRYFFKLNFKSNRKQKQSKKNIVINLINIFALTYSLLSIVKIYFSRKKYIGTYTGDFIYENTGSDFRLNTLYSEYDKNAVNYIEFIRLTSVKNFIQNLIKRKRPVIYISSFSNLLKPFFAKKKYKNLPMNFYESILFSYYSNNLRLLKEINIFSKILRLLKIKKLVLISFSSRSANLSFAAKALNIQTIGIMHGLQQKEYAVYEFMESYPHKDKIGCDVYGCWSNHYKNYFKKFSKISNPQSFFYSGLLRPVKFFNKTSFKRVSHNKIKILFITEPLINQKEVENILKNLLDVAYFEIHIKLRPMINNHHYDELEKLLPGVSKLKKVYGKIDEIADEYDVFIGSHSTAVIEASLHNKISIVFQTQKFGDYFDLSQLDKSYLIKNHKLIAKEVKRRVKLEKDIKSINKIRSHFFGSNKNGAKWIVDKVCEI